MANEPEINDGADESITIRSSSEKARLTDNRRLLDYGFRYFRTKKVLETNTVLVSEQVWGGEQETIQLSAATELFLTLSPRAVSYTHLTLPTKA